MLPLYTEAPGFGPAPLLRERRCRVYKEAPGFQAFALAPVSKFCGLP